MKALTEIAMIEENLSHMKSLKLAKAVSFLYNAALAPVYQPQESFSMLRSLFHHLNHCRGFLCDKDQEILLYDWKKDRDNTGTRS